MKELKRENGNGGRKRTPFMCRKGKHTYVPVDKSVEWCSVCGCLKTVDEAGVVRTLSPDSLK